MGFVGFVGFVGLGGWSRPNAAAAGRGVCEGSGVRRRCAAISMNAAGPDDKKYKTQRSMLSADKRAVAVDEVNTLFVKNGKPPRDVKKMKLALKHSFCVVSARLVGSGVLVAFARACSDEALNATIWDVLIDPALPDKNLMRSNLLKFLLRELRRDVPGCSVALFSHENEIPFFQGLDFVADPDGIKGMVLEQDGWDAAM